MNLGIRREEADYRFTVEDREKLFGWRYYNKPQAIILSAAMIDGCMGLGSFFTSLRFSLGRGEDKNSFNFFILMDIPDERSEDFLRRNGLVGNDFTKVLAPSEINAKNIIGQINYTIKKNLSGSASLKGDSIVIVGSEDMLGQYGTAENEVLTLAALSQRGQVPLVITEAINLLTKTHKDKEEALSAWLTSRGLDGTKRYEGWVYQAERFIETYEQLESGMASAAEFNEKLYKPFASHMEKNLSDIASGRDERGLPSFMPYLEKKNSGVLRSMLYFSTLELWGTKKEELIKLYRLMGADFIRNFNTWLIRHPALTKEELALYPAEHDAELKDFVKKEASFPRNASNLERLLTHGTDMPTFIRVLTNMYQYYVVGRHEDAGFTRKDAEACVFHAMQHRDEFYAEHGIGDQNNLSSAVSQRPELLSWLGEIAEQHDRVVVSGNQLSESGLPDYYVMMVKSDFRAAQRRIRAETGEDINYDSCSDEDFTIDAVQKGIKYIKYHYDVMQHDESFDVGGRYADYAKEMEDGRRSFHYSDAFHAIYGIDHYDRDPSHSQDIIEFMCYVDRERIAQRRSLGPNDNAPASMELILYASLRAKTEDMAQILAGTSPKILADIIHYVAVGYRNPEITERYLLKDQPQAKAIMRKLVEAQSEKRRAVIERHLSSEAREFLAKKLEPYDAKKAERERRKALMRQHPSSQPQPSQAVEKEDGSIKNSSSLIANPAARPVRDSFGENLNIFNGPGSPITKQEETTSSTMDDRSGLLENIKKKLEGMVLLDPDNKSEEYKLTTDYFSLRERLFVHVRLVRAKDGKESSNKFLEFEITKKGEVSFAIFLDFIDFYGDEKISDLTQRGFGSAILSRATEAIPLGAALNIYVANRPTIDAMFNGENLDFEKFKGTQIEKLLSAIGFGRFSIEDIGLYETQKKVLRFRLRAVKIQSASSTLGANPATAPIAPPSSGLGSSATGAAGAIEALPQEWHGYDLKAAEVTAELSRLLQIENILERDKSTFIFSEKVTFDNGLGVLLPKIAKSGMRIAVIATNDRQRALIDELNQGKPEDEKIVYAATIAEVRTKIHTARYYYFKVIGDPDTDLQGVTTFDITEIVKKIIDALGKLSGIVERERLELLHEAARKFAEAA